MPDPIKRLHYFDHQFLRVDDFATERHVSDFQKEGRSLAYGALGYPRKFEPGLPSVREIERRCC